MKKILTFLILLVFLSSCYEDYLKDFNYSSVYFTYQNNVRTFVVGEGMQIEVGVVLGGIRTNDRDRVVNFELDNTLISAATLANFKGSTFAHIKNAMTGILEIKLLPANYYSLSNNTEFVIPKGENTGVLQVDVDSAAFLADVATLVPIYVLPFRITDADADSIIPAKNYAAIAVKYENMLYGNYWHGGVTIINDGISGLPIDTIAYYTAIPSPDSKAWALKTIGADSLVSNGVSDISSSSKPEIKLVVDGPNITVESVAGARFEVLPDGASTFNQAKLLQNRRIYLSYKYLNGDGNWCHAMDTLTFRNRVRDGVNEWQDENPSHY